MNNSTKKNIFFTLLGLILFSASLGYTLVFAGGISGKIEYKVTENVFTDSIFLNTARIYLIASDDISDISITGDCEAKGVFVEKKENIYSFDITFLDTLCDKPKAKVYFSKGNFNTVTTYNIITSKNLFIEYVDSSNSKLNEFLEGARKSENNLIAYKDFYNEKFHLDYIDYLNNNRKYKEVVYMKNFLLDLISKRQQRYQLPIKGVEMATKSSKLPNSGRPYRANYTDGIHEGWDFDTYFGNTVSAIDYGIVIRVVNNFSFSDLGKIKETGVITEIDKMWNLDTLRGNQVWLKTAKGDMAFYAHLNEVFSDVKEGDFVFKGQPLGTVGISGVPDKNYSDYHLHLEVRQAPYIDKKIQFTYEDYMSWPWYFKGESERHILDNQYKVFQKIEN